VVDRASSGDVNVRRCRIAVTVLCLLGGLLAGAPAGATTTALRVEATGTPKYVHGSDGREHVDYDLVITNAFSGEATLQSLEVRGDGKRLLTLKGDALAAVTRRLWGSTPTVSIAAASTAVIYVDIALPRSAGRRVPRRLANRISYAIPADAPFRPVISRTIVHAPDLPIDRRSPIVIASPLRGSGWWNGNGCCDDVTSLHRNFVLASNGSYVTPEIFAVDWLRIVNDRLYTGDGKQNRDWLSYGAPVYAATDGTVVSTVNRLPDIAPHATSVLTSPEDYAGNNVIIRLAVHRYAVYGHLQRGSVRVKRGQRVRTGQVIGLLGNSGNTDAPHLHFGIQERPDFLSNSLPFEIDHFTVEGTLDPRLTFPPGVAPISVSSPHRERRALALIGLVTKLAPGPR
jgi:hypothetical protein